MKHIQILERDNLPEGFDIVEIDSSKLITLREFYESFAAVFEFPDYFGFNMDSLDEIINDLSWIENERILIYFTNSEDFLIKERNQGKVLAILDLLDAACEEWEWIEPDEFRPKKSLKVVFSHSERINKLLTDNSS